MRFYQHTVFSLAERIEIQAGLRAGHTQRAIAIRLGRSASALSTKLKRHGGRVGYCAQAAHRAAHERRARVHRDCYATNQTPPLRDAVHAQLRRGWSTEEIAGMLEYEHPRQAPMHTSHESIYRYFYVIARGELQRKLTECLRRSHRTRQPQRRGVTATQGKIPDMVLVDERPAEVEDRLIAGRYEGDLMGGQAIAPPWACSSNALLASPCSATCPKRTRRACARPSPAGSTQSPCRCARP